MELPIDIDRDTVTRLCETAASEDPAIAGAGLAALFPGLVERLNDSFDPRLCSVYDQVFAQVIDFHRRLPAGFELEERLRGFGLMNEADLLDRKSRIRKPGPPDRTSLKRVKKAIFLSRVTIGADVTVTSVIMAKLRRALPGAEFVLIGSRKLDELFGGDERIRVRQIAYERGGGVLSRLRSWMDVVSAVEDEIEGLKPEEFWLIDPDSRLTQLGLLPLVKDESNYLFFESRSYQPHHSWPDAGAPDAATRTLARLASNWIGEIIDDPDPAYPFIALPPRLREFGLNAAAKLRNAGTKQLATVSLGVGGNQSKRIPGPFEEDLIQHLLRDSNLIIDKGATSEERDQIDRIIEKIRAAGRTVIELNEENAARMIRQEAMAVDVLTWDGGIGAFSALTAASDQYIGYDSAGQHIAAALGVPALTIFVSSNPRTFAERWRPYGPGPIEVLNLDAARLPDAGQVLSQTLTLYRRIRKR